MFDTIMGLPLHPLVVHGVVVLGPLAALVAIAYAVRPASRLALRSWLVGLSVIAAGAAVVATESGEQLEHRLKNTEGLAGAAAQMVEDHAEGGELARTVLLVFLVIALAAAFWALKPTRSGDEPASGAIALVTRIALAVAGVAVLVTVMLAGHSGATSVWSELIGG